MRLFFPPVFVQKGRLGIQGKGKVFPPNSVSIHLVLFPKGSFLRAIKLAGSRRYSINIGTAFSTLLSPEPAVTTAAMTSDDRHRHLPDTGYCGEYFICINSSNFPNVIARPGRLFSAQGHMQAAGPEPPL